MPTLNDIKDYRNFNNTRLDNVLLKSIVEQNDIDISSIADVQNTVDNTIIKTAAKNKNDNNISINSSATNDDNDNDDDDWDLGPDDDNDDFKSYSNLDLTRQVLRKVREYMKAEKMSMSEFARQTGVSKAWLSKLKHTDANLSLNTAQDLLHYMGYTLRLTREGSVAINKSRIKKYACKGLIDDNQSAKYVTAEGQQIAPTPSSVQQTQTSTLTQTTAPTPTTTMSVSTPAAPVKLNPGQTITVSASTKEDFIKEDSIKEDSIKEGSIEKNNNQSKSKTKTSDINGSLASLAKEGMRVKKQMAKQVKKTNNNIINKDNNTLSNNNNILNENEINLLYAEDFFSTPLGQKK